MSIENQTTTHPPPSNFTLIFNIAVDEYKKVTKEDLHTHPFSKTIDACNTPNTILNVFRGLAQALSRARKGDDKLTRWLDPTVQVLFTLSSTLKEGIGLVSPSFLLLVFASTHVSDIFTRQNDFHWHWSSPRGESLSTFIIMRLHDIWPRRCPY